MRGEEKKSVYLTEALGEPFYLPKADHPGWESVHRAGSAQDDSRFSNLHYVGDKETSEKLGLRASEGPSGGLASVLVLCTSS